MTTKKPTQVSIDRDDKEHPKVQAVKNTQSNPTKHDSQSSKGRTRLISRSESKRSLATDMHEPTSRVDSQNSKSSLHALNPRNGLSVFRIVQVARTWKRMTQRKQATSEKPKLRLENTYRLNPDPEHIFRPDKVEYAIRETLSIFLRNFRYSTETSRRMSGTISSEIKSRVKAMNFSRYKIVSYVILMQNKGQGSNICSRCLWAESTDSFASFTFKNQQIICVANVFAVYYE